MKILKAFLIVLFCSQVSIGWAQEKSHDQLVEDFIVKSGLQQQVEQFPGLIKMSFEQRFKQDQKMSAADRHNLRTAASESFESGEMLNEVRKAVAGGLSAVELAEILKWLNSPLGVKITQLEEQASSEGVFQKRLAFEENRPELQPERLALIKRLDRAAQMTEYSTQIKIDTAIAMAVGACSEECNDFSREQMIKQVEKARPQIMEDSRRKMIVNNHFVYQSLTDAEFIEMINFYETPAGQKSMRVVMSGLSQAIKNASAQMGEKLGAALKEKEKENDSPASQ